MRKKPLDSERDTLGPAPHVLTVHWPLILQRHRVAQVPHQEHPAAGSPAGLVAPLPFSLRDCLCPGF